MDNFREIVLKLFESGKKGLKKNEIMNAGTSQNLGKDSISKVYSVVMKDICVMKGNTWILKDGS